MPLESKRNPQPFDPYEVFYQMLREQFGMSPEKALERINRDLASNPLTADMKLEPRPKRSRLKRTQ